MEKKMVRFPTLPQLAKIASLLLFFLLAPFLPSSLRAPYLYLFFNALVVALGVEAGFLAAPRDEKKPRQSTPAAASPNLAKTTEVAAAAVTNADRRVMPPKALLHFRDQVKLADHAAITDVVVGVAAKTKKKIKKTPSRASIFFIGSVETDSEDVVVDATVQEEEEKQCKDAGDQLMSKQELFTKAEAFIGNFYKQLKMQREESWQKLQDLYHHHHYYKAKNF